MSKTRLGIYFGGCIVLLTVALIALRSDLTKTTDLQSGEGSITSISNEQPAPSVRLSTEAARSTSANANGETQAPAEESLDVPLARRQQDMADAIFALAGRQLVQMLTDSGLAPSDSEEIARRYSADYAACAIGALAAEARRQSMSVDELISQVSAAAANGNSPFDVIDRSGMEAYAAPCEAEALQRAGIAMPPAAQQLSDEDMDRLNECVASYANTDITDRVTILELCGQEIFE